MNTTGSDPNKVAVTALFTFALICTVIGRAFTAIYPDYSDAMLFAYIGEQWTLGRVPYVDIWDNKPPGIFALVAAVFSVFPRSFTALSIVEGAFIMGCITSVYALMRELRAPWPSAALATACVAVMSNLLFYNERGLLTEIYMLFPASLSMLLFCRGIKILNINWIILAGISSGLASVFSPKGLSPFMSQIVFMLILFTTQKYKVLDLVRILAANACGVMLAWAPFVIYFLLHDAGMVMWDAAFVFNIEYGSRSQPGLLAILFNVAEMLQPVASLFVAVFLGAILYLMKVRGSGLLTLRANKQEITPYYFWTLMLGWVCADLAGAMAGGRNYSHYFLALAPSLSVTAGFTYWQILYCSERLPPTKVMQRFVFLLIVVPLLFPLASDTRRIWRMINDGIPNDYWVPAVKYLKSVQHEGDTLFTWDYLPALYFKTNMGHVTRYLDGKHAIIRESIGNEVLDSIGLNNPTYIVEQVKVNRGHKEKNDIYSRYNVFLSNNYVLAHTTSWVRIYVLRRHINRDPL